MLFKTQTPLGKDGQPLKQSYNAIVGFRNSLQLAYNADHELTQSISITQQGIDTTVITTDYHYDAFGRRTHKHSETKLKSRKHSSGKLLLNPVQTNKTKQQHTSYLWDGNRQLQQNTATHTHTIIYEQDSFEPVAQFIWLRDGLTAANDEPESYQENQEGWYGDNKPVIKTGVQLYHYHNDHLGTPNELTDQQGDVVWYADYEAWGNTATVEWKAQRIDNIVVSEEHLQPIRFQGQSFDTETGLHYNRFRYFDPDLGMFTTRDPIGLMGGTNVFQYAPNPTGWIDPFGLNRVGRWMSKTEHGEMTKTGKVIESSTGTTHVATPASVDAFSKQAKNNTVYVEFDIPDNSVRVTNTADGWGSILGPNSLDGRLAKVKGQPIPEMPAATDIKVVAKKEGGVVSKC